MKAVVFHDVDDIRVEDVPAPPLHAPTDALCASPPRGGPRSAGSRPGCP
jgi:hypothetical protein